MTQENRRDETEIHKRLTTQDLMLKEIHDAQVRHLSQYAEIEPALKELVTLWRGSKLIGILVIGVAALLAAIASAGAWLKDHIR